MQADIEEAKADRLASVNANRFELEDLKRQIASAKHELDGVVKDLGRAREDHTKLVAELRDLQRKRGN